MRGGLESLHLPLGRKGTTPLPPLKAYRTLRGDGRSHGRTRGNKGHLGNKSRPGRAEYRRTHAIIHCRNSSSCQRSTRRQTSIGRTQATPSKAGILRVHCPHTV